MSVVRWGRWQFGVGVLLLLVLHFYVRARFWDAGSGPDFLLIAMMFYAMRSSPGAAALAGFAAGFVEDALVPIPFGASAMAYTLVAFAASWGRAVFFADNVLVTAAFVAVGVWVRDLLVLVASGFGRENVWLEIAVRSPLQALMSGVAAVVVLVVFRQWFAIRFDT